MSVAITNLIVALVATPVALAIASYLRRAR